MRIQTTRLAGVLLAAVLAAAPAVGAQTNESWCGTDRYGATDCPYWALSDCDQIARFETRICAPNPEINIR